MRNSRSLLSTLDVSQRRRAHPTMPAMFVLLAVVLLACVEREIAGAPDGSLRHWLGLHAWLASLHFPWL